MRTQIKRYIRRRRQKAAKRIFKNSEVDFNGYKRVYHFHIRKSAGTSVNAAFWDLGGLSLKKLKKEPLGIGKKRVFVRNSKELIEEGNFHYGNSHIPYWNLNLHVDTFTFCFFRDPFERLVSLYRYHKWTIEMPDEAKKTDPYFESVRKEARYVNLDFSDYLDKLSKKHLMNQLYMFSENYDVKEALQNVEKISAVYFQHNFNSAINDLSQKLNLELAIKRERSDSGQISFELSEIDKKKAKLYLQPEYEFYNIIEDRYEN